MVSDFQLLSAPAKAAKNKNPLDIENSVRFPPTEVWPRLLCYSFFSKTFFFKIPEIVHRRC